MTRITLQADSLISTLPTLLPADSLALLSQQEAIGALLHTINTTIGFELIAIDKVSTPIHADTNLLPVQWNDRAPDFTFKYHHPESSTAILTIKVLKLSNRTLIHGSKDQSDAAASFEFSTSNYVSPSYFPSSIDSEPLVHAFVSAERLEEFVAEYLNRIVKVLTPEVSLESQQPSASAVHQTDVPRPDRPDDQDPPPTIPSRPIIPSPPNYRLREPTRPFQAGQNPYEIGRQDLDPIPNPFAPAPLFGGVQPGGGMYVGPDHPMFAGPMFAGRGGGRGQMGPWGGDGFAPQGARFDPVGPFGRGGFAGAGRGRGGPPGAFGGDPDNDEFLPPGPRGPGAFGGSHSPFGGMSNDPGNMYM